MPIQTVTCPECGSTQQVDLSPDQRATLQHIEGQDVLKVRPRVMPIHTPERSERPEGSPDRSFNRVSPRSRPGPFNAPTDPIDLNRGD